HTNAEKQGRIFGMTVALREEVRILHRGETTMIQHAKDSSFLRLFVISLFLAVFGLFSATFGTDANAQASKARPKPASAFSESATTQQPLYSDYKGVRIGM